VADFEAQWLKGTNQISQAARVTARALRDSPSSLAISNNPLVRLEMLYSAFGGMLAGSRVAGVRRGDCVLAVAGAVQPGHCIGSLLTPEVRTPNAPDSNATDTDRFLYSGSIMAVHDLLEPHWHVGPVGVEPGFQSMGMGRAVMRLLCDEFDEHRRRAWLETDKPANVRFYIALGFEVVAEEPMLTSRFWFMRREAQ
jgi:ribosomal protein S18 acetylase RimI-like enzyme